MHYYIRARPKDKLSARYSIIINGFPRNNYYTGHSYNSIWIADITLDSGAICEDHRIHPTESESVYRISSTRECVIYRKPKINKWEF